MTAADVPTARKRKTRQASYGHTLKVKDQTLQRMRDVTSRLQDMEEEGRNLKEDG